MTDAELIARLRDAPADGLGTENLCLAAADRIEALTAKLAKAMHVIKGRIHWEASGLTCDCGECQALVATVAQIEGESHD